jgi:hypothetical protein
MRIMPMELITIDGELLNKHSDGERGQTHRRKHDRHYSWSNPLAFVPREGELLTYKKFSREGTGEEKTYRVVRVIYHTEEDTNNSYKGWVEIRVSEVTGA